ncbi:hypothetical protein GQ54DRAFT_298840 [Martensiomyces pterosporus]|nr:hypothetical protein GQ54DRAFT_298840 [Martensiomyces pterosporus]
MSAKIERYFFTASLEAPALWEVSLARNILQSCHVFFTELERVKLGVHGGCAKALCSAEWDATESRIDDMLKALHDTEQRTGQLTHADSANAPQPNGDAGDSRPALVRTSRETVAALRACIKSLAGSKELGGANEFVLRSATMALHTVAVEVKLLHDEAHSRRPPAPNDERALQNRDAASAAGASLGASRVQPPEEVRAKEIASALPPQQMPPVAAGDGDDGEMNSKSESKSRPKPKPKSPRRVKSRSKHKHNPDQEGTLADKHLLVQQALLSATQLAGLLRIFTRVSQRSWVSNRSQLAHAPSVPSPLSSSTSSLQHRRWVSEDIESEAAEPPGLRISVDGKPFDPQPDRSIDPAHARNQSDSQLQIGGDARASPAPHKSAMSLRGSTAPKQAGPPSLSASEPGERSKQVRFLGTPQPSEPAIDRAQLQELVQKLAQFEKAISALEAASKERANQLARADGSADAEAASPADEGAYVQAIKGLATAFIQLSKSSSATDMVKHYDKNTLAHFKAATQAVKLLMPLFSKGP